MVTIGCKSLSNKVSDDGIVISSANNEPCIRIPAYAFIVPIVSLIIILFVIAIIWYCRRRTNRAKATMIYSSGKVNDQC
jgi:hypothetical protein